MSKYYTCPQGHHWEILSQASSVDLSEVCPICGSNNVAVQHIPEGATIDADHTQIRAPGETPSARYRDLPEIPGYEMLGILGRGGMGIVYLARQTSLNRLVALKMIYADLMSSPRGAQRFRNEAESAATLDNPHIVPIYEVNEVRGHPYFSMKLVEGGSLVYQLDTYADPRRAAKLMLAVARAIQHAHQRGILHRDLKPSNILLDLDGNPYVADFGLAKRLESDDQLTRSGAVVGTPSYMAPEQTIGKRGAVTVATDVYGLGALLYTLLTGKAPFEGETSLETLDKVRGREPVFPRHINRAVDVELETVCLKCLEKDAARRYPSAEAVALDLERWLAGEPIEAQQIGRLGRLWRWCRRNPRAAGAVAAATAALVSFTVISTVAVVVIAQKEREARQQRDLANEQARIAREQQQETRRHLYASAMSLGWRLWENGERDLARGWLSQSFPRCGEEDLRGFEWHYLWGLVQPGDPRFSSGKPIRQLIGHKGDVYCAVFAPDGRTLATAGKDKTLRLWDVKTGTVRLPVPAHAAEINWVAYSPDGKQLVTASEDKTARIWDAASGQLLGMFSGHTNEVVCAAFSPDGKLLATAGRDGTVRLWDVHSKQELLPRIEAPHTEANFVVFSPDGKSLASTWEDFSARLWRFSDDKEAIRLNGHGSCVLSAAFSSDSRILATGDGHGFINLWDTATGDQTASFCSHGDAVQSLAFAADRRSLVSGSDSGKICSRIMPWGVPHALYQGHRDRVWCVAISPDGRLLASACRDGTVKLWEYPEPPLSHTCYTLPAALVGLAFAAKANVAADGCADGSIHLRDASGRALDFSATVPDLTALALSPDGTVLAAGSRDGMVHIWSVSSRQLLARYPADRGHAVNALAFSPDGDFLATCGRQIRFWDFQGRPRGVLPADETMVCLAFSPDGRTLASGGDRGTIQFWSVRDQAIICQAAGPQSDPIGCLAFAPDGRTVAAGSDRTIRLWDVTAGRAAETIFAHADVVNGAAFSPDGKTLVTVGRQGAVKLWSLTTAQEVGCLSGQCYNPSCVAFAPDGKTLATGGSGRDGRGELYFWFADAGRASAER